MNICPGDDEQDEKPVDVDQDDQPKKKGRGKGKKKGKRDKKAKGTEEIEQETQASLAEQAEMAGNKVDPQKSQYFTRCKNAGPLPPAGTVSFKL